MARKMQFMSYMTLHKPKKATPLLEPIQHDDEKTIHRLVSVQHQRSFAALSDRNLTHNEEEQLYELNKMEILNSINDDNDDNHQHDGIQNSIIRDITFSPKRNKSETVTSEIGAIQQILIDHKSHKSEQNADYAVEGEETALECFRLNKDPKHHQKRYRIKRKMALKYGSDDDHKQNMNTKIYKPLNFKSISGYLEKKSASKFVGWQKRWFYLWKDTLDYYKDTSICVRGSISLRNMAYVTKTKEYNIDIKGGIPSIQKNKYHKPNMFTFQIVIKQDTNIPNAGRRYYIRAKTKQQRDEWIDHINNNLTLMTIHQSKANKASLDSHPDRDSSQYKRSHSNTCVDDMHMIKRKRYKGRKRNKSVPSKHIHDMRNKEDIISFKDILLFSNTGDILLFNTKSKSGACVRAATGGNYDHIGMIFRVKGGKVGVLEALGSGIQVFLWRNFLKYNWHEQYTKFAFRSLIIPDMKIRKEIKKKLAQFVRAVVNKHYGFNPMDLIRKQSALELDDEARTFFCSELIAKAFKEVGLLRSDFASSQYFPAHFQASKGLTLLKGCSFSNEMEVIWSNENDELLPIHNDVHASDVQIVSLNDAATKEKKQRLKSPPPRLCAIY